MLREIISEIFEEPMRLVGRLEAGAWIACYVLFMMYAFSQHGGFLFIDNVNLVVHEGGHLLFGWFGQTMGLWGGTLLQWLVPALLAAYFFVMRQTTGFVFSAFVFFENFLYTATYIGDARAQVLPLVSVGDSGDSPHDWFNILSSLGMLQHDLQIEAVVRFAGWLGMVSVVAWLIFRAYSAEGRRGSETI